ncbi:MAG: non-heme iron oxygenase ferredoxin subunit [Planctomycetes bacterium]|nr:non-heme iron oxygenase ferredoxin subunit [Planctomycetota bacterium]
MGSFHKVAKLSELRPGDARAVVAGGMEIALFNLGGTCYALDGTCTHAGGPLGEGSLEDDHVVCPWHGARFCVKTGVSDNPIATDVRAFPVKIQGDDVWVEID